jgi:hypothetical protein
MRAKLKTAGRLVLVEGDAQETIPEPLGLTLDEKADLAVQERVLRLASSRRLIVPRHDPMGFERFPMPGGGVALIR